MTNRRNFLKNLGTAAVVGVTASTTSSASAATIPDFESAHKKVLEGQEISDIEATIYAGELNKNLWENLHALEDDLAAGIHWNDSPSAKAGLRLWADLQKNMNNVFKVHPYVVVGILQFCNTSK